MSSVSVERKYSLHAVAALKATLFVVLCFLGALALSSEITMPGYGFFSQVWRLPADVAASRAAHLQYFATRDAKRIEEKFINSVAITYKYVACPKPAEWAALGPEGQQRWHNYFQSQNLPLVGESKVCYDP